MQNAETPTLNSTIHMRLTSLQQYLVNQIDAEDFSDVRRSAGEELRKRGNPVNDELLDAGVLALKQFYAVVVLDPMNEHVVPDAVNLFWRAHTLDARDYRAFSNSIFGEHLYREPCDNASILELRRAERLYAYTKRVFEDVFSMVDDGLYPTEEALLDPRTSSGHQKISNPSLRGVALFPRADVDTMLASA